ncbi:MAG: hypothetical protein KatS3mg077_1147 [Candidatus Binatia bacterium]|nr:MAG: hypothetical protein KatS3mg077_1147 [Candidatus Binatia bacterium]GIW56689.1 MAG: hypothetical protein KatS3mg082_3093 [Nitrospiraceae bacterium]
MRATAIIASALSMSACASSRRLDQGALRSAVSPRRTVTTAGGPFMVSATMSHVANDFLYRGAEHTGTKTGPAFLLEDKVILREAKTQAVDAMAKGHSTQPGLRACGT